MHDTAEPLFKRCTREQFLSLISAVSYKQGAMFSFSDASLSRHGHIKIKLTTKGGYRRIYLGDLLGGRSVKHESCFLYHNVLLLLGYHFPLS